MQVPEAVVDMGDFDKRTASAEVRIYPPTMSPGTARGSARGISSDPVKIGELYFFLSIPFSPP